MNQALEVILTQALYRAVWRSTGPEDKGMAPWRAHRPHQDLAPAFLQAFTTHSPHLASSQDMTRVPQWPNSAPPVVPTTKNEVNTLPLGTMVQWITTEVVEPF